MKPLVHARLCRGRPTSCCFLQLPLHFPPLGSPLPVGGVTSGSLQAQSRCAAERWIGMCLWGKTFPSSCWCQLAPCPLCLHKTDSPLVTGMLWAHREAAKQMQDR
jgi:hypothetical protein